MGRNKGKPAPRDLSHKTCLTCGELKSRTEFSKSRTAAGGIMARCKDCVNKAHSAELIEINKLKQAELELKYQSGELERPIKQYVLNGAIRKICIRCFVDKPINDFAIAPRMSDGYNNSCKECYAKHRVAKDAILKEKYLAGELKNPYDPEKQAIRRKTFGFRTCEIRKSARERKLECSLTEDDFRSFWKKPCSYCGDEIETIGLDRINSDIGYVASNVRSACFQCNVSKFELSVSDFKSLVVKLYFNLETIKNAKDYKFPTENERYCPRCGGSIGNKLCQACLDDEIIVLKNKPFFILSKLPLTPEKKVLRNARRCRQPDYRYKTCRYAALKRNYEFSLSFEQFMLLWRVPCFYCGSEMTNIGIDRIDNTLGYFIGNIVPCDSSCNFAKSSHSMEKFTSWIERAYKFQNQ